MIILAEYGVALTLRFPVIKAASQDFAGSADWTPATGDTKLSKDGGNVANTTNNPSAVGGTGSKLWSLALTATEMQAAEVVIQIVDSATKAVEDQSLIVQTYGNASARHKLNLNDSVRAGLSALPNASAGASGGLPAIDSNLRVAANAQVVGDKTGYALTTADKDDVVDRVWDENIVAVHQATNAAGKTLTTRVTAGAGALSRTLGVTVAGNPLEGASVWVTTDSAGTNVVAGSLVTSSLGIVTLLLDAGAYYAWVQKDGYTPIAAQPITIS